MKKCLVGLVCVGLLATAAMGQILAFEFSALAGNEAAAGSSANDPNLATSAISRGAGLTASANGGRFNATSWATSSIANAVAGDDYMEFTISPQPGYQFSVSSIYVQWQRSSTGNSEVSLRSSLDGYASDLAANWTLTDGTATQSNTWTFTQADAAGPVSYRLYSYAETVAGSGGPGDGTGDDIVVYGTVSIGGFGVGVDKANGFTIEQGTGDTITATAVNGVEPYAYSWTEITVPGGHYETSANVFTILDTAPVGDYSVKVTATDSSDPQQQAERTVTFSVVAPAVKYAIAIVTNAPANGTVTTTPATEAEEGQTVTVNATPAGGYVVQSIAVVDEGMNPVAVNGTSFTMPASAVTVTVTFMEAPASRLVISQYTETDTGTIPKGIEIWNVSGSDITFDGAANLLDVKVGANGGAAVSAVTTNSGTLAAGAVWVIGTTNMNPDLVESFTFNGDDAIVLELGGVVQDVIGTVGSDPGTAWTNAGVSTLNQNIQLKEGIITGDIDGWTDPSERFEYVGPGSDLTGFGIPPGGAAVFEVNFDKPEGFTVEEGAGGTITATAANGTEPYGYAWLTDMTAGTYTNLDNVFTITPLAPTGSYYASVIATDGAFQVVTNTIHFSVVEPAPTYPIAIATNPAAGGTVTTTPAGEATNGQVVVVTATPTFGYAVGGITATESGGGTPLPVVGNTFVMTNAGVLVEVTFVVYEAPDLLIDFEDYTTNTYALHVYNTAGVSFNMTNVLSGSTVGSDRFNGLRSARFYHYRTAGNPAMMSQTAPFAQAITKLNFWFADYGSDSGGSFKVQVSDDGANWQDVGEAAYDPAGTTLELGVIDTIPANMTYVQFVTLGESVKRLNIDDIGVFFGVPSFSVSLNRTNGFTVAHGAGDAITATPANGTEPIGYGWSSDMDPTNYTAVGNVFTIQPTAAAGDFSATVYATNSDLATAQATVSFTILAGGGEIWQIGDGSQGSTMFYATSNRNIIIILPTDFMLDAVYATDSSAAGLNNLGQGLGTALTPDVDYTYDPVARMVSILSGVTNRRVLRIGATPP